jgi:perosamine synthetase
MTQPCLPYGRQRVDEDDIAAVVEVLRGDWLTTGPRVAEFERAVAEFTGARHAVAVSSGTAALHAAMAALGVVPGDEVIVPALTFAATANCVVYLGATPVFADVCRDTLLVDVASVEVRISPRTRAVVGVDYAGQPCDYDALGELCRVHRLALVADACHSLGAAWRGRPVGTLADLTTFSFHPVKPITTGEGGMVVTDDAEMAARMRTFRNHGITTDHRQREQIGTWYYEMASLGFNYRLNDIQCALGLSQMRKLRTLIERRRDIARQYDRAFAAFGRISPLCARPEAAHGYHLYVVRLDPAAGAPSRAEVFRSLRARGIGVNVHYVPVHLHPFYRSRFGTRPGLCPVAEAASESILSLPIYPAMTDEHVQYVIDQVRSVFESQSLAPAA